jgi:putative addiction module component (TIGR02574 family)
MAKSVADYRNLPTSERIQLVEDIWDRIAQDAKSLALTDEQRAELDRRWAEHERDPSSAIPWDQVRSELVERGE